MNWINCSISAVDPLKKDERVIYLLKKEIKTILYNKKTYLLFVFFLAIMLLDLWINYTNNILIGENVNWENVFSPPFMSFLSGKSEGHFGAMLFSWCMPLYMLVCISDSYTTEYKLNYHTILATRCGRKKEYFSKLKASFIMGFSMTLLALLVNHLLAIMLFHQGMRIDIYMHNTLNALSLSQPEISYIIYMLIAAIIFGLCAMYCSALSFCLRDVKFLYAVSYFIWLFVIALLYSIMHCIQPFIEYGFSYVVPAFIIYAAIVAACCYLGYRRKVIKDDL